MTAHRDFHLGDILSITTDRLVSPHGIKGVYDILNHMTGENLYTHQLVRAGGACKPVLLENFPELANVDATSVTPENYQAWMDQQVTMFGETRSVAPLDAGVYEPRDPFAELFEMMDPEEAS